MKIGYLITQKKSIITGGHLYNNTLIEVIENEIGEKCEILDDQLLSINRSKFTRIIAYKNKIHLLMNYDILIIPSSNLRAIFVIKQLTDANIKTLVLHHHYEYMTYSIFNPKRYILKYAERQLLRSSWATIFPNQYPFDIAQKNFKDCVSNKYRIKLFQDLQKHQRSNVISSRSIIYVGTIEKRKGIDLLIKAIGTLNNQDFTLNIVGKYSENQYYKKICKLIKKYNINDKVNFCGRVSNNDLHKLYATSRFFVMPSLNEGYGLVMAEAMSYGLPVIAFDNTAMPYLIHNDINGFVVKNKDYKMFGEKIALLMADNDRLEKLSKEAYKIYDSIQTKNQFIDEVSHFVHEHLIV